MNMSMANYHWLYPAFEPFRSDRRRFFFQTLKVRKRGLDGRGVGAMWEVLEEASLWRFNDCFCTEVVEFGIALLEGGNQDIQTSLFSKLCSWMYLVVLEFRVFRGSEYSFGYLPIVILFISETSSRVGSCFELGEFNIFFYRSGRVRNSTAWWRREPGYPEVPVF